MGNSFKELYRADMTRYSGHPGLYLIAPNSYVNIDIPSHSVVFGNPCVVKHRNWATEDYINHIADLMTRNIEK